MMIENGKFTKQSLLPIADTDLLQPGFTRGEVQLLKSPGCKASDNCVTIHDANVVAKSVPPLKSI